MAQPTDNTPQIFQPEYYRRLYEIEEKHWWAMGMRDLMAAWLDKALAGRATLHALDVGCGTGLVLGWLRRYPLIGKAVGIDLSAHALAFSRQRGATALARAAADRLPLSAGHFDVIVCLDTLQHVAPACADRETVVECARLLRPGGYLFLRTNSALGHRPLRGVDPNLYRRYRLPELSAMLGEAGLSVERASYANALLSVWGMLVEYPGAGRQTTNPIGPGLSIRPPRSAVVSRLLYGVLRFEAWLVGRLGLALPFGHSIVILGRKPG